MSVPVASTSARSDAWRQYVPEFREVAGTRGESVKLISLPSKEPLLVRSRRLWCAGTGYGGQKKDSKDAARQELLHFMYLKELLKPESIIPSFYINVKRSVLGNYITLPPVSVASFLDCLLILELRFRSSFRMKYPLVYLVSMLFFFNGE